jgi:hypothetical protein
MSQPEYVQYNTRHLLASLRQRIVAEVVRRKQLRIPGRTREDIVNEALGLGMDIIEQRNGRLPRVWIEDYTEIGNNEDGS